MPNELEQELEKELGFRIIGYRPDADHVEHFVIQEGEVDPDREANDFEIALWQSLISARRELEEAKEELSEKSDRCTRLQAILNAWSIGNANIISHWEDWVAKWIRLFESKDQADEVYHSARSNLATWHAETVRFQELATERANEAERELAQFKEREAAISCAEIEETANKHLAEQICAENAELKSRIAQLESRARIAKGTKP